MLDLNSTPFPALSPCILSASVSVGISSNISVGDHLKFDTIHVQPKDNRIYLDTVSPYATGATVPSLGRFRLLGGYIYTFYIDPGYVAFSGSGPMSLQIWDLELGAVVHPGAFTSSKPYTSGSSEFRNHSNYITFPATKNIFGEIRIFESTSVSQIGDSNLRSILMIKTEGPI